MPPSPTSATASQEPSRWFGIVTISATLAAWIATPLLIKEFTGDVDLWTSNGWRYGFAALIWLPTLLLAMRRRAITKRIWLAAMIPAGFNIGAQVAFTAAFYLVDAGLVTFGLRGQIIVVAIGAAILFPRERKIIRDPRFILGMALVAGGTSLTAALGEGFGGKSHTMGVLLAVAAGCGYACYGLAVRACMQGVNAVTAFSVISQYTAIAMVGLMLLFGERMGADAMALSADRFSLFLLSALIGIALGHVLFYLSIARLGVAASTAVIQLQPFGVATAALVLFGERLTVGQWVSGATAVAGAGLIIYVQHSVTKRLALGAKTPPQPPFLGQFEPMGGPDPEDPEALIPIEDDEIRPG